MRERMRGLANAVCVWGGGGRGREGRRIRYGLVVGLGGEKEDLDGERRKKEKKGLSDFQRLKVKKKSQKCFFSLASNLFVT